MKSRLLDKLGPALLIVAAVIAVFGIGSRILSDDGEETADGEPSVSELPYDPGFQTPEERMELWGGKAEASETDFVSRTNFAQAVMAYSRNSGDHPEIAEADKAITEALEINPSYLPARILQAGIRNGRHDAPNALKLADEILAEFPDEVGAKAVRGDALLELGRYEEAGEIFDELAADRAPSAVARQARLAYLTGDPEAVSLAERAADTARGGTALDAAWFQVQASTIAQRTGATEIAAKRADAALELAPDWPYALAAAGKVAISENDLERAEELYRSATDTLPEPDWLTELGDLLILRGEEAEGQALIDEAVETGDPLLDRRALIHIMADHEIQLDRALELAQADADLRGGAETADALAWALFKNGDVEAADEAATDAIAFGIREPAILYRAGEIAIAAGETDRGRDLLATALELDEHFDPVDAPEAAEWLESAG